MWVAPLSSNRYKDRVLTKVELLYPSAAVAPVAPVPTTAGTGGTILAGVYGVKVTYVNAAGESLPSANGSITTVGTTSTITVPSPPASGVATGWYAYVTQLGGTTYTKQQATPTPIGTALTLTAPPTSTGAAPPINGAIGAIDLDARGVTFTPDMVTLTTEGTTQNYTSKRAQGFMATIENSVFHEALQEAFNNQRVLTVTGESWRDYSDGKQAGGNYGLRLTFESKNIDTGAAVVFKRTFPKMSIDEYTSLDGAPRMAVPLQRTVLSAIKTETDLAGTLLPGIVVGDGGRFYFDSKMT